MSKSKGKAYLIEAESLLKPIHEIEKKLIDAGCTIRDIVDGKFGKGGEFPSPTICLLNSKAVLRENWDTVINDGDVVCFVQVSSGWGWALVAIFVVTAAYVIATMPSFDLADSDAADSVYTLSGQRNKNRLGKPIECAYGRNRLFPSLASSPYTKFIGNDQWFYALYSLGHGTFDIEKIQIEDTDIDEYDEIEYQVIQPNGTSTLFRDNVDTSTEVGEIELFAPNNPNYSGWTSWFTANEPGTLADVLEVDVLFPRGLYNTTDKGSLTNYTVTVYFRYQRINDSGGNIGSPVTFFQSPITRRTNTPLRFTFSANVDPGRYKVSALRVSSESDSTRVAEIVQWVGLKAYLPNIAKYPVTTIALKAQATNNLNDKAATRLNVIATRKLPIWNGSSWSNPTATRSIVWAFCDVWRSEYGANLPDEYLNLSSLRGLDAFYSTRQEYFDWVFDEASSTWDAAKVIAGVGRAEPVLIGPKISMVRESEKTTPVMFFNRDNIVKGSFVIDVVYPDITKEDGLEVEYIDPNTFMPEQVLCKLPDEDGENPKPYKIAGIQDATHAYREGMFRWSKDRYQNTFVNFETGREGLMLTRLDAIGVTHELPNWNTGGIIISISGSTVTLSEDVPSDTDVIIFTTKSGSVTDPLTASRVGVGRVSVTNLSAWLSQLSYGTDVQEPSKFTAGKNSESTKLCIVEERESTNDDTVRIRAFVYSDEVYDYDSSFPPGHVSLIRINPTLPVVTSLAITPFVDNIMMARVAWNHAEGSTDYALYQSDDGVNWQFVTLTKNNWYDISVNYASTIYVKVAGVNGGRGPFKSVGPILLGTEFTTNIVDDASNKLVDPEGLELMAPSETATDVASFAQVQESINRLSTQLETKIDILADINGLIKVP